MMLRNCIARSSPQSQTLSTGPRNLSTDHWSRAPRQSMPDPLLQPNLMHRNWMASEGVQANPKFRSLPAKTAGSSADSPATFSTHRSNSLRRRGG
jgi:hypothetical protein